MVGVPVSSVTSDHYIIFLEIDMDVNAVDIISVTLLIHIWEMFVYQ